jgi:hypothetical protein
VILEREFVSKGISGRIVELEEVQEPQDIDPMMEHEQEPQGVVEQPAQVTQDLRRSGRIRQGLEKYGFLISEPSDVLIMKDDEPSTYEEAVSRPGLSDMA